MSWMYNHSPVTEAPEGAFGFIYKLTLLKDIGEIKAGSIYIGKKQFSSTRKTARTKKDKAADGNNRKKIKYVTTPMKWETYWSSSKEILALVAEHGTDIFKRDIIEFTYNKYNHSFKEIEQMILHQVHKVPTLNGTIGKYFISKLNPIK